jgi:hypothetical protein
VICAIVAFDYENEKDQSSCESIRGRYEIVGTETAYMMVGKVIVPNEINVYGCVKE